MQSSSTLARKKLLVANLIQQIAAENSEVKTALENRDLLLFRSFRLAHPELFHENADEPICMNSLQQHFNDYLLTLSRMGFLTYYLEENQ